MVVKINHTWQSGAGSETLSDVESVEDISAWTVEVTFTDGRIERFYAVDSWYVDKDATPIAKNENIEMCKTLGEILQEANNSIETL